MDFSEQIRNQLGPTSFTKIDPSKVREMMSSFQGQLVRFILERMHGNQSRAASCMGVNRNTLRKMMSRHGIDAQKMRDSAPLGETLG